ncbi:hypothetical protein J5226_07840 [Lysobacter sp. K5869]|uniref:hypothetical protein n=1 Tax=Lysobacter sp. K5869 TaxID=2820808 RepID=UPI001C062C9B|nr:hypothetical protein [Lysobacter sp. K5869]QWP78292.1 hypothetical protein J5226_07840 [Lysobacter sp. K5869]
MPQADPGGRPLQSLMALYRDEQGGVIDAERARMRRIALAAEASAEGERVLGYIERLSQAGDLEYEEALKLANLFHELCLLRHYRIGVTDREVATAAALLRERLAARGAGALRHAVERVADDFDRSWWSSVL